MTLRELNALRYGCLPLCSVAHFASNQFEVLDHPCIQRSKPCCGLTLERQLELGRSPFLVQHVFVSCQNFPLLVQQLGPTCAPQSLQVTQRWLGAWGSGARRDRFLKCQESPELCMLGWVLDVVCRA